MPGLNITVACSPSDRSRPVMSGEVPIEGCQAELVTRPAMELLRMAAREMTYDVTEMSMSSHLVLTARETPHYVAIPVYHSRLFRHSSIYVNTTTGINRNFSIGVESSNAVTISHSSRAVKRPSR